MTLRSGSDDWLSPRPRRRRRKFRKVFKFAAALGGFLVLSYEQQFDALTRAPIGWLVGQQVRIDTRWGRKFLAAATVRPRGGW